MAANEKAAGLADAVVGVVVAMALNYWQSSESQQRRYFLNRHLPDLRPPSPETTSRPLSDGPIELTKCSLMHRLSNKHTHRETLTQLLRIYRCQKSDPFADVPNLSP